LTRRGRTTYGHDGPRDLVKCITRTSTRVEQYNESMMRVDATCECEWTRMRASARRFTMRSERDKYHEPRWEKARERDKSEEGQSPPSTYRRGGPGVESGTAASHIATQRRFRAHPRRTRRGRRRGKLSILPRIAEALILSRRHWAGKGSAQSPLAVA